MAVRKSQNDSLRRYRPVEGVRIWSKSARRNEREEKTVADLKVASVALGSEVGNERRGLEVNGGKVDAFEPRVSLGRSEMSASD